MHNKQLGISSVRVQLSLRRQVDRKDQCSRVLPSPTRARPGHHWPHEWDKSRHSLHLSPANSSPNSLHHHHWKWQGNNFILCPHLYTIYCKKNTHKICTRYLRLSIPLTLSFVEDGLANTKDPLTNPMMDAMQTCRGVIHICIMWSTQRQGTSYRRYQCWVIGDTSKALSSVTTNGHSSAVTWRQVIVPHVGHYSAITKFH